MLLFAFNEHAGHIPTSVFAMFKMHFVSNFKYYAAWLDNLQHIEGNTELLFCLSLSPQIIISGETPNSPTEMSTKMYKKKEENKSCIFPFFISTCISA